MKKQARPRKIQGSDESYKNGPRKSSLAFAPFLAALSVLIFLALGIAQVQHHPLGNIFSRNLEVEV